MKKNNSSSKSKTKRSQKQFRQNLNFDKGYKRLLATGLAMGTADVVPGVSGGTIAFLFGIYEELLFAIKKFTGTTLKLIITGKFKKAYQSVPIKFLAPLFIGIILAFFSLARLVSYLLEVQEILVWSFFVGLVLASALVVSKRVSHWNWKRVLAILGGAALAFGVTSLASGQLGSDPFSLFITGMIAFCALILPGISGSSMMVILGQYETVVAAVSEFNFKVLFFVAAGGAVGLALFAHFLTWLFKNFYGTVVAFLVGMLLGSLRAIWPWHEGGEHAAALYFPAAEWSLLIPLVLAAAGFVLVLALEGLGLTHEHDEDIDDREFKELHQEASKNSQ